jgi:TetR/AcrR family transcriptional regulator
LHSENIAQGKHIERSAAIKAMYNPLMETIDDLLSRGVAMGLFRSDASSVDLYICICAMAAYSISNRYTLSAIFGTDIYAPKRRNRRRRQISDMLVGYLQYR